MTVERLIMPTVPLHTQRGPGQSGPHVFEGLFDAMLMISEA